LGYQAGLYMPGLPRQTRNQVQLSASFEYQWRGSPTAKLGIRFNFQHPSSINGGVDNIWRPDSPTAKLGIRFNFQHPSSINGGVDNIRRPDSPAAKLGIRFNFQHPSSINGGVDNIWRPSPTRQTGVTGSESGLSLQRSSGCPMKPRQ
jgi:hypothetical protein